MKKAKANGIAAVYVACPECGTDCENSRGSLLIIPEDTEVSCVSCGQSWQVSSRAFGRVRKSKDEGDPEMVALAEKAQDKADEQSYQMWLRQGEF